jgi:hypothetical protein
VVLPISAAKVPKHSQTVPYKDYIMHLMSLTRLAEKNEKRNLSHEAAQMNIPLLHAPRLSKLKKYWVSSYAGCLENELAENNHPNRLEQIVANNRNIHGSGNKFILPVIPVQAFQQQFWERFKFTLISCIRA